MKRTYILASLLMIAVMASTALAGRLADRRSASLPSASGTAVVSDIVPVYASAELRRVSIQAASQAIVTANVYRVYSVTSGTYTQLVASVVTASNVGSAAPSAHTPLLRGDAVYVALADHAAGTNAVVVVDYDILRP